MVPHYVSLHRTRGVYVPFFSSSSSFFFSSQSTWFCFSPKVSQPHDPTVITAESWAPSRLTWTSWWKVARTVHAGTWPPRACWGPRSCRCARASATRRARWRRTTSSCRRRPRAPWSAGRSGSRGPPGGFGTSPPRCSPLWRSSRCGRGPAGSFAWRPTARTSPSAWPSPSLPPPARVAPGPSPSRSGPAAGDWRWCAAAPAGPDAACQTTWWPCPERFASPPGWHSPPPSRWWRCPARARTWRGPPPGPWPGAPSSPCGPAPCSPGTPAWRTARRRSWAAAGGAWSRRWWCSGRCGARSPSAAPRGGPWAASGCSPPWSWSSPGRSGSGWWRPRAWPGKPEPGSASAGSRWGRAGRCRRSRRSGGRAAAWACGPGWSGPCRRGTWGTAPRTPPRPAPCCACWGPCWTGAARRLWLTGTTLPSQEQTQLRSLSFGNVHNCCQKRSACAQLL